MNPLPGSINMAEQHPFVHRVVRLAPGDTRLAYVYGVEDGVVDYRFVKPAGRACYGSRRTAQLADFPQAAVVEYTK